VHGSWTQRSFAASLLWVFACDWNLRTRGAMLMRLAVIDCEKEIFKSSHGIPSIGRDGALRRPRRVVAAQRVARVARHAWPFPPAARRRGHRSAMSLPATCRTKVNTV